MIANLIVAFSNFVFISFAQYKNGVHPTLYLPMLASFIYHLAETKHGLPGFPILRDHAYTLLNVDRFFAAYAGIYMLCQVYNQPSLLTGRMITIGLLGFVALACSEYDTIVKKLFDIDTRVAHPTFVVSHCIWHWCAFRSLSYCIR